MFKKVNNKLLGVLFFVLLAAVVLLIFADGGKSERTFREELVDIDTSAVTRILIYPKSQAHREVELFKQNEEWKVKLSENKTAPVQDSKIKNMFNQLNEVKPKRLAARGEEKWVEFQTDSTGTRVKVFEGDEKTLDLIIGRLQFQQPRSVSTYVRLTNDTDVYETEGFLDFTFNQPAESFRDATVVTDETENWNRIIFDYPDSSFVLTKEEGRWLIDGEAADSAGTEDYFNRLSGLSHTKFADEISKENLADPVYNLKIESSEKEIINISAYRKDTVFYITSSQNPEAVFDGEELVEKVFVSKNTFGKYPK